MMEALHRFYKTMNILCIDDDEAILSVYEDLLGLIFNEVYLCRDGCEGLELYRREKVDIVLTDFKMPCKDGLAVTRQIRRNDPLIPIILVTALESLEMLREAIDLHITGFIKKPITYDAMRSVFNLAVKSVMAERYLLKEKTRQVRYKNKQESLTWKKECRIIKNELETGWGGWQCDIFYRPKDILSGDSYLLKRVAQQDALMLIVDGMGKGVSAAVTAMFTSAFVNYSVNRHRENFSLEKVITDLLDFLEPNLLDEEIVSLGLLHFESRNRRLRYALFSMPAMLGVRDGKVEKFPSNNLPLSAYTREFRIDSVALEGMERMLFYSDGLSETTAREGGNYAEYLEEDFFLSRNQNDFEEHRRHRVTETEDDVTYLYLYRDGGRSGDAR